MGSLLSANKGFSSNEEDKAIKKLTSGSDPIDALTDAQLDEFRDAFAAFDKDGGGSIDAVELKALMASVGQVPTDAEVNEMVRLADADGSGSIDFPEFVTLMAHKMAEADSEDRIRGAFSVFDYTGDGFIDAEELRNLMINVGEPATIEDVRQVLTDVDRDGDGRINYAEFTKVVISKKSTVHDGGGISDTSGLSASALRRKSGRAGEEMEGAPGSVFAVDDYDKLTSCGVQAPTLAQTNASLAAGRSGGSSFGSKPEKSGASRFASKIRK